MPRRSPSPSSPTLATKVIVPGVCTRACSRARAIATSTASPRQLSPIPGPRSWAPTRDTFTFVSSGNTVSRCAAMTSRGRGAVPGRSPSTLPAPSMRTFRSPFCLNTRSSSSARAASLKGGAGTSQIRIWSAIVWVSLVRADSSAALTARFSSSISTPSACWAIAGSGTAIVVSHAHHGGSERPSRETTNPSIHGITAGRHSCTELMSPSDDGFADRSALTAEFRSNNASVA